MMSYNDDRHVDDGMRHCGLVPTKSEREEERLRKRIAELEGELAEYHGASAWIHHWMLAEKYRKPDVPALVESAKVKYKRELARIAELEAETRQEAEDRKESLRASKWLGLEDG